MKYRLGLEALICFFFSQALLAKQETYHSYNAWIPKPGPRGKQLSFSLKGFTFYFKNSVTENFELGTDIGSFVTLRPNFYLKYKLFEELPLSFLFQASISSKSISSLRPRIRTSSAKIPFKSEIFLEEKADYSLRLMPRLIYTYKYTDKVYANYSLSDSMVFEKWSSFQARSSLENPLFIESFESHEFQASLSLDYFFAESFILKPFISIIFLIVNIEDMLIINVNRFDLIRRELTFLAALSVAYQFKESFEFELGGSYGPAPVLSPFYHSLSDIFDRRDMIPSLILKTTWRLP